ncbi:hypothetical protein SLS57_009983 [Botryosphaeria dothidea]
MAEALGIAAAAVQFIEISAKLLIAASNLRSKLENAPAKVKHTERSVKQLASLVERLDADLRPTSSASLADVLSDSSKLEAQNLLEDCITETSALTDLLERLMGKPDDTFVKGKMRAFVSVKKEDEIAERCTRLQDLKSHLELSFMSSHGAGGFSLFPGLKTVNIVDPEISPAFQQPRQVIGGLFEFYDPNRPFTFRELNMGLDTIGPLREAFENLHEGIRHVFMEGSSSGQDITVDGQTLLHVGDMVMSSIFLQSTKWVDQALVVLVGPLGRYQQYLSGIVKNVLQLLLQQGVDINAEWFRDLRGLSFIIGLSG